MSRRSFTAGSERMSSRVPAALTRSLLVMMAASGLPRDRLLAQAGFAHDPLQNQTLTDVATPSQYSRLCGVLCRQLDDETLGTMPDASTPPGTLRLVALSMLGCGTLGVAMQRAIEFNTCCRARRSPPVQNRLLVDADAREATLTYLGAGVPAPLQHRVLAGLAIWLRFCSWLIGQEIDTTQASCAGPQPRNSDALRHFFPGPVEFGARVNAVTFSARHLEAAVQRDEQQLAEFMAMAPYFLLHDHEACHSSISRRIRGIIGDDFQLEMPSFEELTVLLNMSARTLRRRLESEGTSYQRIKDKARRDRAISLLRHPELSVCEVAEVLGFSDPSAFHRSFKKWTGQSPGAFR
ncbi:MAG: AraC family transcriptional regulator ligand-binding domain-containing protein [Haliea sp.]|uniref:AraC family transcriptional regulator n=1 Tax=Haliea sp. TaxID=1932666 RepID=UPI0032EAF16F